MDVAVAAEPPPRPLAPPPSTSSHGVVASLDNSPSDEDLDLQWDQTYLRINYIVRSLAGPVPLQLYHDDLDTMSTSSSQKRRRLNPSQHQPIGALDDGSEVIEPSRLSRGGHVQRAGTIAIPTGSPPRSPGCPGPAGFATLETAGMSPVPAANSDSLPAAPAGKQPWPTLTRAQADRKRAQIQQWRHEVSEHGAAAYCACSAPWSAALLRFRTEDVSDGGTPGTTARGLLPAALVAGSAGGSSALVSSAATTVGAGSGTCGVCSRAEDPGYSATPGQGSSSDNQDGGTGGGSGGGGGGGAKKALSRFQGFLHRLKRRKRARAASAQGESNNNNIDKDNNCGTNVQNETRGDLRITKCINAEDLRNMAAATISNATLMYHVEAPPLTPAARNSGDAGAWHRQGTSISGPVRWAGPSRPRLTHVPPPPENADDCTSSSGRDRRSSLNRLARARKLLEKSHNHLSAHPPNEAMKEPPGS